MGEVITFLERKTVAKGLNSVAKPSIEKIKTFIFKQDFDNLKHLMPINTHFTKTPVLFYPGCGNDILFPLLYFERLFPNQNKVHVMLNDIVHGLGIIKTTLDDIGISFEEKNNHIRFYYNDILVITQFVEGNTFEIINNITEFDIYFERAFRIIRDQDVGYERKVYSKLKSGGILISDSGYTSFPLIHHEVPTILSSYNEMIIGTKPTL